MGGGASREADLSGGKTDPLADSHTKDNVRDLNGGADVSGPARGLQCTVVDAVSNTNVPFTSSIAATPGPGKNGKGRARKGNQALNSSSGNAVAQPSSEDPGCWMNGFGDSIASGEVVRFGDTTIPFPQETKRKSVADQSVVEGTVRVHPGTVAQHTQNQVLERGDWSTLTALVRPQQGGVRRSTAGEGGADGIPEVASSSAPSTPHRATGAAATPPAPPSAWGKPAQEGVLVGGAFVRVLPSPAAAIAGTAQTPLNTSLSPTNVATQPSRGGEKFTVAQSRAAVYTTKTRCAVPINFKLRTVGGQSTAIRAIAASADGTLVASVFAGSKTAQYFDGFNGQRIMDIKGHLDPVVAIAHSRDGKFLLTSSSDGNVCLWDLNNGKKLREIPVTSQANSVAISDDSDIVATSSTEDFVNLWESKNGEAQTMFQRHSGAVYCVAFSRRGNLVASGSTNGEIFVWGANAGDVRLHVETGARTAVMHVSFAHDGSCLLASDRDVLQVWDLFTGGLILSRNGTGEIVLGEEGKQLHQPAFMSGPKDIPRITSATFAACNNIVCGLTSKRVLVLEPNTGVELLSLDLKALVTCISASWAGDVLFIGDYQGNHYRLELQYSHRDFIDFQLGSKPPSRDKGKGAD